MKCDAKLATSAVVAVDDDDDDDDDEEVEEVVDCSGFSNDFHVPEKETLVVLLVAGVSLLGRLVILPVHKKRDSFQLDMMLEKKGNRV